MPVSELGPILVEAAKQGWGTKYALIACYALLLYDNLLTLADEVELIWKRKFSAVTFIFFMNRYYSLVVLAIALFEDMSPAVTAKICQRMNLLQPLAITVPLTFLPNFIIALRRNNYLATMMIVYLFGEFGVALWVYLTPSAYSIQLPGPESITDSFPVHECLAHSSLKLTSLEAAAFQFAQTIYDSCCLVLLLCKSMREFMSQKTYRGIRTIIATQGIAYYMVVFTTNISWAVMILIAPTGLKYSISGPTIALAPFAANKLTLLLRSYATPSEEGPAAVSLKWIVNTPSLKRRGSWIGTSTFEVPVPSACQGSMELKPIKNSPPS